MPLPGSITIAFAVVLLVWLITAVLHPITRLIYRPVNRFPSLHPLRRILFYNDYLNWLGQLASAAIARFA